MISNVITIKLEELLEKSGKSLYRLAKDTGISYENLRKMKNGQATRIYLDTIEKLCVALDCELSDLLVIEADQPKGRR
jgi:putative transcriptional regulator